MYAVSPVPHTLCRSSDRQCTWTCSDTTQGSAGKHMTERLAGLGPASAPGFGVTWGGPPRPAGRALTVVAAAALAAGFTGPVTAQPAAAATGEPVSVIVRETHSSGDRPEKAVVALGGSATQQLTIINGFSATVPAGGLATLRTVPGVESVTENA